MKANRAKDRWPKISEAELVVMRVVWEKAPVTANQVVDALERRKQWKPKTIHTLLRRLVQKGALAFDKQGREHHFRPKVDSAEYAHAASRSFLSLFFGGEVAPFLSCFLKREKLSREDIATLRQILDNKEL